MAKKCPRCGASVQADDTTCMKCGAIQVTSGFDLPATPRPTDKKKWWVLGVLALALILAIVLCMKPVMLRFAPRVLLGTHWMNTLERLDARAQKHPLYLVLNTLDFSSTSRLEGTVQHTDQLSGNHTNMHLTLEVDHLGDAFSLGAAVAEQENKHVFSFYCDQQVLTGSYDGFQSGKHFGITYDTLRQDLSKGAFDYIVKENWFSDFEASLQEIRDAASVDTDVKSILEPYLALLKGLYEGAAVTSGRSDFVMAGESLDCDTITVQITQEQMESFQKTLLEMLRADEKMKTLFPADGKFNWEVLLKTLQDAELSGVNILFYLFDRQVIYMEAAPVGESELGSICVTLEPALITLSVEANGEAVTIRSAAETVDNTYTHKLTVLSGDSDDLQMVTIWDTKTGALHVSLDGENLENMEEVGLLKTEEGFRFWFEYSQFGISKPPLGYTLQVDMTYGGHVYIEKPRFVSPDKWDQKVYDDFTYLLDQYINHQR